jgi:hypothetical protein
LYDFQKIGEFLKALEGYSPFRVKTGNREGVLHESRSIGASFLRGGAPFFLYPLFLLLPPRAGFCVSFRKGPFLPGGGFKNRLY